MLCCELEAFIHHLNQTVNRSPVVFVVCRDSVGVHGRPEEEETNQYPLQLSSHALFLIDPQNTKDLHDKICRDHCEEGVSLADERVALVVRRDDVDICRRINRTQQGSDAHAHDHPIYGIAEKIVCKDEHEVLKSFILSEQHVQMCVVQPPSGQCYFTRFPAPQECREAGPNTTTVVFALLLHASVPVYPADP